MEGGSMDAFNHLGAGKWLAAFGLALLALLVSSPTARAGVVEGDGPGECPTIVDKPDAVPHVAYDDVQHLTYCYGPMTIRPGQNTINIRQAKDGDGNKLWPQDPDGGGPLTGNGYITRFDPEFVYADGSVPRVDVLHLHHAFWGVNGSPQFAAGEEKTIQQLPQGFGWPTHPSDNWFLNDMLHELLAQPA